MSEPNSKPIPKANTNPNPSPNPKLNQNIEGLSVEGSPDVEGLDIRTEPVGYKRPPRQHRFQKGSSGNPQGRPKGKRSRKAIVERVLLEKRVIEIDGRPRELTMVELVILALRQEALKGKSQAFKTYRSVEGRYGPQDKNSKAGYLVIPYVETMEQWMALWGPGGDGCSRYPRS